MGFSGVAMKPRFSLLSILILTTGVCVVAGAWSMSVECGVIAVLFIIPALAGWLQNHIDDFR